ncbi:MAG TPA: hypothetical protein VGV67_14120, partial [Solirubrobacteraceae bacterium]|nr:hypothetical protein [Solirubrobacteraceae bacterium]
MSESAAPVQPTRVARASAWVALAALITGLAFAPPWHVPSDVPPGFAARLAGGALERLADREWVDVGVGELLADGTSVRAPAGVARLNVDCGRVE